MLHQLIWSWYTGRWWVGCYIWYSEEYSGQGHSPSWPLLVVPNVTADPSTASVPITVLLYDGPLLCSFNVAMKGLTIIDIHYPLSTATHLVAVLLLLLSSLELFTLWHTNSLLLLKLWWYHASESSGGELLLFFYTQCSHAFTAHDTVEFQLLVSCVSANPDYQEA